MNIRIIIAVILLLIVLITGTLFLLQSKSGEVVDKIPDTSFIGVPTAPALAPGATFVDLLTSTPDSVQQKVLDNIHIDEYYLYPCNINNSISDVLVLVAQYKQNNLGINSFATAETALKAFENEIYKNWGHIIFRSSFQPNLYIQKFNDETVTDPHVWSEMYRVGTLSDNKTEIYYGWLLNYIVIASSKECLLGTMESVYGIH